MVESHMDTAFSFLCLAYLPGDWILLTWWSVKVPLTTHQRLPSRWVSNVQVKLRLLERTLTLSRYVTIFQVCRTHCIRNDSILPSQPLFQIGDRVLAVTDYHSWAELVAVPVEHVYKMPTGMSFHDGAAFFMSYVTAYIMMFDLGNFRDGQSVLIHSVGGGVVSDPLMLLFIFLPRKFSEKS